MCGLNLAARIADGCRVGRAAGRPETGHIAEDAAHLQLFRALHEIAVAVGGVLDPLDLARIVVEQAAVLLGADAAGVYLWDQEHNTVQRLYSSDAPTQAIVSQPGNPDSKGAAGQAVKLGIPISVPDYRNWPHANASALD